MFPERTAIGVLPNKRETIFRNKVVTILSWPQLRQGNVVNHNKRVLAIHLRLQRRRLKDGYRYFLRQASLNGEAFALFDCFLKENTYNFPV